MRAVRVGLGKVNRKQFLTSAALGAAGVAAATLTRGVAPAPAAAAGPSRSAGSRFLLELDQSLAGILRSAEGGNAFADVVVQKLGSDPFIRKHLGNVRYEDISVDFDFAMENVFYNWIADTWEANFPRKSGAILGLDASMNVLDQMEFEQALISETTIPALDASSREVAFMTLKFRPEETRMKPGTGAVAAGVNLNKQKTWQPSNFRLQIDGVDCTRVNKIDSFTVKQKFAEDPVGEDRDYEIEPTSIEFPNLGITLAQSSAESWYDWFDDFVIKGNNGQDKEKTGAISFLSPDLKTELGRITLSGLGIFKLKQESSGAQAEAIQRVKAELYCEVMQFHVPPPA